MATLLARPTADTLPPAAKPPSDSSARPSPLNWDNPIERLLAKGEAYPDHQNWRWKATTLLRAKGEGPNGCRSVGCIAFDDSCDPLPAHLPYRRSELLCLVTLVCHAMSGKPLNTPIAATLLMFTTTTLRLLQMRIDPNECDSPDGPNLYITTRDTLSLDKITSEAGYGDWLQVISWIRFRFASHQATHSEELFPKDEGSETASDYADDDGEGEVNVGGGYVSNRMRSQMNMSPRWSWSTAMLRIWTAQPSWVACGDSSTLVPKCRRVLFRLSSRLVRYFERMNCSVGGL
ncbi:hypothetical protein CGLO_17439 [Colletotrichum gloeosporioides Cg-14]|uniref:Uncharacterized protein n=1 Tax=Colletotrichum gloeosporioides (strain Cg-14) TaxID=1237896 RepID=T0JTP0_COLGC|nr:hypothetical protein CGLO_17439 [Colletotrichum gloeosporioides Cg-14]